MASCRAQVTGEGERSVQIPPPVVVGSCSVACPPAVTVITLPLTSEKASRTTLPIDMSKPFHAGMC
jgi:hypothetical protein